MSESDNSNYIQHYQTEYFRGLNKDNDFLQCDSMRKLMAMTHIASLKLGQTESNCTTLNHNFMEYAKKVDSNNGKNAVNNYAAQCLSLAGTCNNKSNAKSWKSLASKIKDDIVKNINTVQRNNISEKHVKLLLKAKNSEVSKSSITLQNRNVSNKSDCHEYSKDCTSQKTTNSIPSINNKPLSDTYNQRNTTNFFTSSNNRSESTSSTSNNTFRTAKSELILQQMKKNGQQKNNMENYNQQISYGAIKRSLGTRRGVSNKFVPPVISNNNGEEKRAWDSSPPTDDVMIDERLRHIDPKMVELIRNEIMDTGNKIGWDDIAGLEFAKSSIQESVVWPLLRPDIFTGLRRPPKGILLFGPPGTGKTLIGKCIASQSGSTFFSISASSLTSKWVGDGEKMVRALFAVAVVHQPAVVFIDEIDSLLSQRSDTEHESSRRIKTEFLVQLDGAGTGDSDRILVIGATNRPQELDEAARRRLVKRLYIPLPDVLARKQMVFRLMQSETHSLSDDNLNSISQFTDGYSGSDMKNLCQEAALGPIRSLDFRMIQNIKTDEVRPITFEDFQIALKRVRASVSDMDLDQYIKWNSLYGSG